MGNDMIEYQRGESSLRAAGQEFVGPQLVSVGRKTGLVCVPKPKSGLFDRDKVLVFHESRLFPITKQTTFGRGEGVDILFDDDDTYVSRRHGYVQPRRGGVFYVHDGIDAGGSTNGTRVVPVSEIAENQELQKGGWSRPFVLGQTPVRLNLHRESLALQKNSDGTTTLTDRRGRVHQIADPKTEFRVVTIGRQKGNDIEIADDSYVSRKHAKLYYINGVIVIEDTYSTNGTTLEPVRHRQTAKQEEKEELKTPTAVKEKVEVSRWGTTETIGRRAEMEDAHTTVENLGGETGRSFYAIYDGHGGKRAADLAAKILHNLVLRQLRDKQDMGFALTKAFVETDQEIEALGINDGATAIVAIVDRKTISIANAGDARAVLDVRGRALRVSRDHKPDDSQERRRIQEAGGFVSPARDGGVARVNGSLAVARALGDREYGNLVSPIPDIKLIDRLPEHKAIILACDGVWDVISDQEAVNITASTEDPQEASNWIMQEALRKGSRDNISVLVVKL